MTGAPTDRLRASIHHQLGGLPGLAGMAAEAATRLSRLVAATAARERLEALLELLRWALAGNRTLQALPAELTGAWQMDASSLSRMQVLAHVLTGDAELRQQIQAAFVAVVASSDATALLADAGIPSQSSFLAEANDRLHRLILPSVRIEGDLADLVHHLLRDESAVAHLQRLTPTVVAAIAEAVCPRERVADWAPLRDSVADALELLATRIAAEAATPRFRARCRVGRWSANPFHRQAELVRALIAAWRQGEALTPHAEAWRVEVARCRSELERVRNDLEHNGVSVAVIFATNVMARCLTRTEQLLAVLVAPWGPARWDELRRLLVRLAGHIHEDRSVRRLIDENMRLLYQRIVARSGEIGGHYIAHDRAEYRHIWIASAGGGLLTVGTAAIKAALTAVHGSAFVHGMLYGLNYAGSFVLMQHAGLMLATKQPAVTAAALATVARRHQGAEQTAVLCSLAARICASQVASAAANVVVVALGAVAFDTLYHLVSGDHWMTTDQAAKLTGSLHPFASPTIVYAALTGIILWASSLVGGWMDNWRVYHRISQSLSGRMGVAVERHFAGWATNISLGMMLGFVPAVGEFLGVPLDVRHVTLNSGMLAFAACTEGREALSSSGVLWALGGITTMFVLNLGVSFTLSLVTALRADGVRNRELLSLFAAITWFAVRHPVDFLVPRCEPIAPRPAHT